MKKINILKITILASLFLIGNHGFGQCWSEFDSNGYTIGIKADGSLWGWGRNFNYQLGIGNNVDQYDAVRIGNDSNWLTLEVGESDSFGIKTDGTLWGWGRNEFGQLGIGNVQETQVPTQVGTDTDWKFISNHSYHTLALKTDNTLWGWGNEAINYTGFINSTIPAQIGTDTWKTICAAHHYVIGIKSNGTMWAWGDNESGRLGDGTTIDRTNPIQIGTDNNWDSVSSFSRHTMAIKTDGSLWGWGLNAYGCFGNGTITDSLSPIQIGNLYNWSSVCAGYYTTHAIKTDGTLWAAGYNAFGQLGTDNTLNKVVLTQIGTSTNWKYLKPNYSYCQLGIKTDGTLWGWGSNQWGQTTGNGTNTIYYSPTIINCPTLSTDSENFTNNVSLFPNPVKDILYFQTEENILKIDIFDIIGRKFETSTIIDNKIDLSELKSGSYIIKLYTEKGILNKKIIKE
jgi:alpha-tubulin suppressor-like RCC1 family protein